MTRDERRYSDTAIHAFKCINLYGDTVENEMKYKATTKNPWKFQWNLAINEQEIES